MQPWTVPAPTLSAPSRKAPEREADDPEGNLAIVERVVRKSQRLFPYWEHSWAGTAHRSASTQYGTPRTTALWSNTSHNHIAIVERVVRKSQRLFPYWEHSWAGTAHRSASTPYDDLLSQTSPLNNARHFPRLDKHCIRRATSTPPLHFGAFPSIPRRLASTRCDA